MATNPFAWPEILTNKDWQKKKGLLGKAGGKTGIGDAMTAAQRAHAKVDRKVLHVSFAVKGHTNQHDLGKLEEAKAAARAHYSATAVPTQKLAQRLHEQAKTLAKTWSTNSKIPQSAKRNLDAVIAAANEMAVALSLSGQEMRAHLASFDERIKAVHANRKKAKDAAVKEVAPTVVALEKALASFEKDPSSSNWDALCRQPCRNMANAVSSIPALNAVYWDDWKVAGTDEFVSGCPVDRDGAADFFRPKVAVLKADLAKFKQGFAAALS